jgi:hypothetical protein
MQKTPQQQLMLVLALGVLAGVLAVLPKMLPNGISVLLSMFAHLPLMVVAGIWPVAALSLASLGFVGVVAISAQSLQDSGVWLAVLVYVLPVVVVHGRFIAAMLVPGILVMSSAAVIMGASAFYNPAETLAGLQLLSKQLDTPVDAGGLALVANAMPGLLAIAMLCLVLLNISLVNPWLKARGYQPLAWGLAGLRFPPLLLPLLAVIGGAVYTTLPVLGASWLFFVAGLWVMLGFAVAHSVLKTFAAGQWLLLGFYAVLTIFPPFVCVLLVVGVLDVVVNFRQDIKEG